MNPLLGVPAFGSDMAKIDQTFPIIKFTDG